MRVDYFHVADESIIARDGKISVIGIFDVIWAESVPAVYPKLSLLLQLSAELREDDGARGLLAVYASRTVKAIQMSAESTAGE